jgi:DNA-binding transcriptional LysR family regulator
MQLHQLRYVVAVADGGSFTGAARALRVAQPSVSGAIRGLEREMGVALFDRTAGAVALSPAGAAFLPWARQALADCEAGVAAVDELRGLRRGQVSIGATPSIATHRLPPVLAAFHARYPGVVISVLEGGSQRLVTGLERADLELALVILPVERSWVRFEPLVDERLVLAVRPDHPLADRTSVAVADLAGLPLVMFREGYDLRDTTVAACRREGFHPTFAVEGLEMDGVLACTAAGLGAAVVPVSVASPDGPAPGTPLGGLVTVPFRDDAMRRTIGLASRQDRPRSRAATALTELLRTMLVGEPATQPSPMTAGGAGGVPEMTTRPLLYP